MSTFFIEVVVSTVISYPVEADNLSDALERGREHFEDMDSNYVPFDIRAHSETEQSEWESF